METTFVKLNENWNADPNNPQPNIEFKDTKIVLSFNVNYFAFAGFTENERIKITFYNTIKYRLGITNDEGWYLGKCRFSKMAPSWGEFYQINGKTFDDCINDWYVLQENANENTKHFLFYFKDNTFECKADEWTLDIGRKAKNILFVCSANQLRSPTAQEIYKNNTDLKVLSAGVSKVAKVQVTKDLILWANTIFVMEAEHIKTLKKNFYKELHNKRIICLDIPDEYEYMEDHLIAELTEKLKPYIGEPNRNPES